MKQAFSLLLLTALFMPFLAGCDSMNDGVVTDAVISENSDTSAELVHQTVADVVIEVNEEIIETTSNAWTVKYLEIPEDKMPMIKYEINRAFFDKNEKIIKIPYISGYADYEKNTFYRTSSIMYAKYDMKGDYLGSDELNQPDGKKVSKYEFTDYGYIAVIYYKTENDSESKQGLIKYYKETDEYEIVIEDMKIYHDGKNIGFNQMLESPDGNYYFLGLTSGEFNGQEVRMSSATVLSPSGAVTAMVRAVKSTPSRSSFSAAAGSRPVTFGTSTPPPRTPVAKRIPMSSSSLSIASVWVGQFISMSSFEGRFGWLFAPSTTCWRIARANDEQIEK